MEEARRPVITCSQFGGEKRIVQAASFSINCGSYPNLTIDHHKDIDAQSRAVYLMDENIFESLGTQQTAAFNSGFQNINTQITVDTGKKGGAKLDFTGISLGSSYSFSSVNVSNRGQAMPEWCKMDMLNFSIYTGADCDIDRAVEEFNDIPSIILYVINELTTNIANKMQQAYSAEKWKGTDVPDTFASIHRNNLEVVGYFKKVIENSRESFGWSNLQQILSASGPSNTDVTKTELNSRVTAAVTQVLVGSRGGSFLGTLNLLASQFQCVYVPGLYDPGKLVNMAFLIGSPSQTLKAESIINMALDPGSPGGLAPVGYVLVMGCTNTDTDLGTPPVMAAPKENRDKNGVPSTIYIPDWFPSLVKFYAYDSSELEQAETKLGELSADIATAEQEVNQVEKKASDQIAAATGIAKAWALCYYAWTTLARSVATMTVPGTFEFEIGKRYDVQAADGSTIFTGFLSGYNTIIETGSGALTNLHFSHIMCPGFQLPGTDEMKEVGLIS